MREVSTALEEMRAERDPWAMHIFVSRRSYRSTEDTKGGRCPAMLARLSYEEGFQPGISRQPGRLGAAHGRGGQAWLTRAKPPLHLVHGVDHRIVRDVEPQIRFYRARVTTLNDHHGIIHFLIQEDDGRSMEKVSFDTLEAAFLSSRFDSPLHEMVNRAELTEIDAETFARTRGSRIPSDEVSGMTFWWMK